MWARIRRVLTYTRAIHIKLLTLTLTKSVTLARLPGEREL